MSELAYNINGDPFEVSTTPPAAPAIVRAMPAAPAGIAAFPHAAPQPLRFQLVPIPRGAAPAIKARK
jgi:hypothetical protein